LAGLLVLGGCARTYLPSLPTAASAQGAEVVLESLRVHPLAFGIEVQMRIASVPKTRLWGARFSLRRDPECSGGTGFSAIAVDGNLVLEGPLDIGGRHDVDLQFGATADTMQELADRWKATARESAFVDLSLEGPDARRTCARIPLLAAEQAPPNWRMDPTSAGFSVEALGRAYPLGFGSNSDVEPTGGFFERVGTAFGDGRAWVEVGALFTSESASRHLGLAGGADGALWETGPLSLRAGLGYDVLFNLYRPDPQQPGTHRYTLHGPHASVGISYALIQHLLMPNLSTHRSLPAGHRTLSLELEFPMSLWLGTGDAPATTFVPGVGLGLFFSL
jgi:hypothetical protein